MRNLAITVDKKIINIDLKASKICDGCRLIALNRWGNNLWMSFAFRNEYEPDGHGVHILDIKKKKILSSVTSKWGLFPIVKKDPSNEMMWLAGAGGIYAYDSKLNLKHYCKIIYPFWNENNKDKTIKKNYFEFTCEK